MMHQFEQTAMAEKQMALSGCSNGTIQPPCITSTEKTGFPGQESENSMCGPLRRFSAYVDPRTDPPTPITIDRLLCTKPLRRDISTRVGPGNKPLSYMSGDSITRTLNDVFGYSGWSMDIRSKEREGEITKDEKGRYHIVYTAMVRITHRSSGSYREDCGVGDSIDRQISTAIGHAIKGAVTDAMKRAARHFGEKLGNSLYSSNFSAKSAPVTLADALDKQEIEHKKNTFGFGHDVKKLNDVASVSVVQSIPKQIPDKKNNTDFNASKRGRAPENLQKDASSNSLSSKSNISGQGNTATNMPTRKTQIQSTASGIKNTTVNSSFANNNQIPPCQPNAVVTPAPAQKNSLGLEQSHNAFKKLQQFTATPASHSASNGQQTSNIYAISNTKEKVPPFLNRRPPSDSHQTSQTPMGKFSSIQGQGLINTALNELSSVSAVTPPPVPFYNPLGNLMSSGNNCNASIGMKSQNQAMV
eukprot:CAMPEP_0194275972 /NCGR_PEP_ID=MMETSP0169-20130528/8676_1 /TAXON_ID=218684 /ORGANISM="Corethron pennatum, Strain L29A3" /LENGTH=471 /DNA_ID=CAMNT_0039019577 /DNA_START=143 /DNA_END=1559 /DNA_ORIENTATION=+